jgi:ribonucleoside-diphosphate reductase alpha chain
MRTVHLTNPATGEVILHQDSVEVPTFWSQNATNILASKYFRGTLGTSEREHSLKQVIDRVVDTIADWGLEDGYFIDLADADDFRTQLKHSLVRQESAFNSPVWFNIGVKGVPQQASACFILDVNDSMDAILNWYREEGIIFKGGSGAGVNLSKIRSSVEHLHGGGTASGPVSFMRGADASAGTIKSGGKTRRAAKMVVLNVDHPDIEEFIKTKQREELKSRVLSEAGFDMSLNGADVISLQYQNANNSVRVTDDFMHAVRKDLPWSLKAVTTGEVVKTVQARELWQQIARAAWDCADPGLQFDTTINRWNTVANTARIDASNPCSEYMHISNSACNLASLNLLKFLRPDHTFDVDHFIATVALYVKAQDILVGRADYPTRAITTNAKRYRELGLGYANLGALLISLGLGYDSDEGRHLAAAITSLLSAVAYSTSARLAANLGPCEGYAPNRTSMLAVLGMHTDAGAALAGVVTSNTLAASLTSIANEYWDKALQECNDHGIRNTQISLLAPTGTIGFLMDCDTTGIEPAFSLVSLKTFVGGNTATLTISAVQEGLRTLGYTKDQQADILAHIAEHHSTVNAPHLSEAHQSVFATAVGDNALTPLAHLAMMSAVQPFLSGAISKTVNLPRDTTVEQVADTYMKAWELGIKAIAIYRDGCKLGQPLSVKTNKDAESTSRLQAQVAQLQSEIAHLGTHHVARERLPRHRTSRTYAFQVADSEGYATVGEYPDGRPGEVFIKVSKQGSTLAGIMDAFSIAISLGLQHGVPLETFVRKYINMRFEPAGITDDGDIRIVSSLVDYIFRRLALDYLDSETRAELGIHSTEERTEQVASIVPVEPAREPQAVVEAPTNTTSATMFSLQQDAPYCSTCGNQMQRSGSCYVCPADGTTSGCS